MIPWKLTLFSFYHPFPKETHLFVTEHFPRNSSIGIFWKQLDRPLPASDYDLTLRLDTTCRSNDDDNNNDITACFTIVVTTSNDSVCDDKSRWKQTHLTSNVASKSADGGRCCDNVKDFFFEASTGFRCIGISIVPNDNLTRYNETCGSNDSYYLAPLSGVTVHTHRKTLAEIIFGKLKDEIAAVSVLLMLSTSCLDFVIFYRFYGPFRREFLKIFKKWLLCFCNSMCICTKYFY